LFGNCPSCGVQKLSLCPKEVIKSYSDMIQWCYFALETTVAKNGWPLNKLTFVYKNMTSYEFIEYMQPKLQHFVKHNFVARWENKHFKRCIKYFPTNTMVSIVDFIENFSFEVQNEMQSMHWHTYQISILVHINFRHNLAPNRYDEDSKILIEYHFYISNDCNNDSKFVQHCFKLHW